MSRMSRFSPVGAPPPVKVVKKSGTGEAFVDWKDVENLRRLMSPNGKINGRRRNSVNAKEQRMIAQAIKRARFMALLPYTSATV